MAYVISDSCIQCGACAGGCPVVLFLKVMESSKSTQILASHVVLAQVDVL